jgi:hypothetical protein
MASTFSPDLRIELIGAGEQAGTWNTTTNTNLGTIIEDAIAGYVTVSVTSANQAFTALDGAADQARNATIALTTTTTANFAVYAPPTPKQYVIYNTTAYTATVYNSTVLGNTTAAGLGVAVVAGAKVAMFSNGTNFRTTDAVSFASSTGTGAVVLSTSPTLVTPALGTPTALVGTNITGTAAGLTVGAATTLVTSGFSIVESGGKLLFKSGATTIASMDSSGNFTALANVTAYGTP